ncbi:PadR family transcriptional regulator [Pandoraea cepalis]|uniref:PadR family transcriptional regulator n=1 Tax=Pandoraea cepalis TaxID=2508294 RepID=A0AAW7MNB0_9BURK|nr:PadR family transcriptional regulator [Pandoraea cepalis]MDN4574073.1 PadR family transcriptional regulator [Pandoraea cepalis]MDN4579577.1 PadR family transcriptional regulator [Pandoraea cepalis]
MPLAHALMTSLLEKSSSGYDLARRFDKSIGFFWHATHQQIYRELARMEASGWIDSMAAPDGGRTRKRIYRVLDAGRDELLAWAATPTAPADLRDDLMVRLRADAAIGPLGLQPELQRRAALHAQKLAAYRAIETRDFPPQTPLTRETALQRHILLLGVRYEQGWLDWTREALSLLETWDGVAPADAPCA